MRLSSGLKHSSGGNSKPESQDMGMEIIIVNEMGVQMKDKGSFLDVSSYCAKMTQPTGGNVVILLIKLIIYLGKSGNLEN